MYFYQLHIINAYNQRTIVNCFGQATLTCYQFPSTFFHFIWFTYLKKKQLTWYIHEQIPVPELHNVLSQSTRVCKFLGVIDSATNSPANCHCVPNMSDYIPICLLCDPPGTVYTFIYTWVPLSITWLLQWVNEQDITMKNRNSF